MTPRQIELARHALGLPNKMNKTYRNHFVTGAGCKDYDDWNALVDAGLAKASMGDKLKPHELEVFWLTRRGAEMVLEPNERLSIEDFPLAA